MLYGSILLLVLCLVCLYKALKFACGYALRLRNDVNKSMLDNSTLEARTKDTGETLAKLMSQLEENGVLEKTHGPMPLAWLSNRLGLSSSRVAPAVDVRLVQKALCALMSELGYEYNQYEAFWKLEKKGRPENA